MMHNESIKFIPRIVIFFAVLIFVAGFIPAQSHAEPENFIIDNIILAGNIYLRSGDAASAIREFEKVEKLDCKNPDMLIGLIRAYSRRGDFEKASEKLSYFKMKHSRDVRYHLARGEYLSQKGHLEESADEFIILVEKGIYRFEALQGLIQVYAKLDDAKLLRIIETTISIYEPINQATLYRVLSKSCSDNGLAENANKYSLLAEALNPNLNPSKPRTVVEADPRDAAYSKAQRLMSENKHRQAETLIAESTSKWPSDVRFHLLLKQCYMEMVADVPMVESTTTSDSPMESMMNFNSVSSMSNTSSAVLASFIPEDVEFKPAVRNYLNDLLDVTGKTEAYFNEMLIQFQQSESRMNSSMANSRGNDPKQTIAYLKELKVFMAEAGEVCSLEIDALETINPPTNFDSFHTYLIDNTKLLNVCFVKIERFIVNQDWSEYHQLMEMLDSLEQRGLTLGQKFDDALVTELMNV